MHKFAKPNAPNCPLCGTRLNPGAVICVGCGAKKETGSMLSQELGVALVVFVPLVYFFPSMAAKYVILASIIAGLSAKIVLIKQVRWVR